MGCHAATNGVHHQFGNIDKQGILRRDGVSTRRTPRCTHHPCHHQNARCASSHDHPTVRSYVRALQIRQIKGTPSPSVTWRGRSDGVEKCPPDLNPPAVRQPGNHEDLTCMFVVFPVVLAWPAVPGRQYSCPPRAGLPAPRSY